MGSNSLKVLKFFVELIFSVFLIDYAIVFCLWDFLGLGSIYSIILGVIIGVIGIFVYRRLLDRISQLEKVKGFTKEYLLLESYE